MADNQTHDGTTFQHSELPITCAKGCGFYGTPATLNMCSKCYRDHLMVENQAASARAAVEKSLSSPSHAPAKLVIADNDKLKSTVSSASVEEESKAAVVPKNRCGCCNKKVGMLGFQCRCGSTFCGSHRYPEEHKCTFDFMEVGKKAIEKANPVVKADKLDRF